jgi:hypothetical protein
MQYQKSCSLYGHLRVRAYVCARGVVSLLQLLLLLLCRWLCARMQVSCVDRVCIHTCSTGAHNDPRRVWRATHTRGAAFYFTSRSNFITFLWNPNLRLRVRRGILFHYIF